MVAHRRSVATLCVIALGFLGLIASCNKVPLLAPTGSVINLYPEANTVSLNSQITIVATVIEQGVASSGTGNTGGTSRAGAGTPVQDGTHVTFTTTLGTIQPTEALTHNGQATVTFITGNTSGQAKITAYSGGASSNTTLDVGAAAIKSITLSGPVTLPSTGGSAQLTATVIDTGDSPLGNIPVTFTTDHGTMAPVSATTDSNGNARSTLTTSATANVVATAGAATAKLVVTVNPRGLSSFTVTSLSTTVGVLDTFTVTPTTNANLVDVIVRFGDGDSRDLGAITAQTTVPHVYYSKGTFTATATSTDITGDSGSLSTSVIVSPLPVTLIVPSFATVNTPATFSVDFGGINPIIDHIDWTFDDGTVQTTIVRSTTKTYTSRGVKTVRVDVFGLNGANIGTQAGQFLVQ